MSAPSGSAKRYPSSAYGFAYGSLFPEGMRAFSEPPEEQPSCPPSLPSADHAPVDSGAPSGPRQDQTV